jgi:Holliday junction DNA helicase RuvA
MTVQGVGARMALAVLSVLPPDELAHAIAAQDRAQITRADGVGPKLATRILSELKDKVGDLALARAVAGSPADGQNGAGRATSDAVSALVNLGYQRAEAFGAISHVSRRLGPEATVEALLRDGLKELAA